MLSLTDTESRIVYVDPLARLVTAGDPASMDYRIGAWHRITMVGATTGRVLLTETVHAAEIDRLRASYLICDRPLRAYGGRGAGARRRMRQRRGRRSRVGG